MIDLDSPSRVFAARVLTGDRPTGQVHLGYLCTNLSSIGSLGCTSAREFPNLSVAPAASPVEVAPAQPREAGTAACLAATGCGQAFLETCAVTTGRSRRGAGTRGAEPPMSLGSIPRASLAGGRNPAEDVALRVPCEGQLPFAPC